MASVSAAQAARCGASVAIGASLDKLIPSLIPEDGRVHLSDRTRTTYTPNQLSEMLKRHGVAQIYHIAACPRHFNCTVLLVEEAGCLSPEK